MKSHGAHREDRTELYSKANFRTNSPRETALPSSFFLSSSSSSSSSFLRKGVKYRAAFVFFRYAAYDLFAIVLAARAHIHTHTHTDRQTRFLSRAQLIFSYLSPGFTLFFVRTYRCRSRMRYYRYTISIRSPPSLILRRVLSARSPPSSPPPPHSVALSATFFFVLCADLVPCFYLLSHAKAELKIGRGNSRVLRSRARARSNESMKNNTCPGLGLPRS